MKTATAGNGETAIKQPNRAAKSAVKPASETDASHSAKESKIYIDGKFLPEADAKVSVFDHGLLYGDGIFEGIRFYNGRVFRLEEHLDRLVGFGALDLSRDSDVGRGDDRSVAGNDPAKRSARGYIRLIVTRGVGNLGLNPAQCKRPSVIIIAATIALYPKEVYENGLTVVTCATRRTSPAR